MAGVKSLAIRGIRSFGPDDEDEQRIAFDKPLTLILGQNGCGKTTIIECLRYAITGQMPPGSRNECFVHDAKVNRSSDVLAQVKLKIVNAKDKQLEVSRSMKVTAYAKKKSTFKTLESFLSTIDEDGKTKDLSSRCADLDQVMHEELGVPKAILNSVVFCHQEDSAWPLDEGKKVKERFDEIFDADKYSICFDRLKKIRKEYAQSLQLLQQEVSFLTEIKQDLDKKKLDVVNTETSISETEIRVGELTAELEPVIEKLRAINTLENNLLKFETSREKIKVKLNHNRQQEEELKKTITTLFEGTLEELQETITNHEATKKAKQKELDESYKKITSFNKDEEKIVNEKDSNMAKFNKYILLESQNQEKIDNRSKLILEAAKVAELADVGEALESGPAADAALARVAEQVAALRRALAERKAAADAEEKALQGGVDEKREALSRHKQNISNKESDIQKNKREVGKLEREVASATDSKNKLELLEKKFSTAEEEYNNAVAELNPEQCQQEIADDEKTIEQLEQDLDQLSEKITKLQKQSSKLKEREMIEDIYKQKEKQVSVLKNKHRSGLTELLGQMPEADFAMAVNKFELEVRTNVENMKKQIKDKQLELGKLETEHKHVRESLKAKREALARGEDRLYQVCGSEPYAAALAAVAATVDKLQEEQNVLQSSMFIFAKYKKQLKDDSCCPLCRRDFDSDTEVSELVSTLTTQVMNVPAELERVSAELQRATASKDEIVALREVGDTVTALRDSELPALETRLAAIDEEVKALRAAGAALGSAVAAPERQAALAKLVQADMPLLDRCLQEMKTVTKNLDTLKVECAALESDMTLEEAHKKQSELKQQLAALRAKAKAAQKKLNAHNKKLQQMADKKNKIKEEQLNTQKKVQELVNLQENLKQLQADREKLVAELGELQEGMAPLKEQLKEKEDAKAAAVKETRAALEARGAHVASVAAAHDKVAAVDADIAQHRAKDVPREMDKIKVANEALQERQRQLVEDRQALTRRIDSLKDDIAKSETNKRDLKDNVRLRKAQQDIESCLKDEADIADKLSGLSRDQLADKEALVAKQTALFTDKAENVGKLRTLQDRLKVCKSELKRIQNKDVERNYRTKSFELHVTRAIDKDIKEYGCALERALMEFHREKMENINRIIRELWRKIYRGNDIDYIEIKTESSMSADSERRKYDYRVVQCKTGVEIDMRGRCSAGQKVLACLIIRLALAETFSARFGILALDEPTTNLDEENVRSLCGALADIVQQRALQPNFMFIVITHDREFVRALGGVERVHSYYEVSRNHHGKSRIKRLKLC